MGEARRRKLAGSAPRGIRLKAEPIAVKIMTPPPVKAEARRQILAMPLGQRPALAAFSASDGRMTYGFDGISIRRMQ